MQVGRICSRRVVTVLPTASAVEVARRMRDACVGSIVVAEPREGRRHVHGIVTDRDLVVKVLAVDPAGLASTRAADLLTGEVVSCRERDEVSDALELMKRHGIRRMPVIDASGDLAGIIALDDALRALADDIGRVGLLVTTQRMMEAQRNDD